MTRALSFVMIAAFLAILFAPAFAQAQQPARMTSRASAGRSTLAGGRATTVFGYVWNANNDPIAFANVRLRNVVIGRIEANAVAADNGEFSFDNLEGGTYVIEYVNPNSKVLAVGHVFSVSPGETVATFIRLANRLPWFAALLGSGSSAAATVISSAASLGVTAIAPGPRPVTGDQ
jgi:hypothetical protein